MRNNFFLAVLLAIIFSACSSTGDRVSQQLIVNSMESPAQAESGEPFLFTYQDSIVYLSWIEKKGEASTFKFSSLVDSTWTTPSTIASDTTWFVNWADYPMITRTDNNFLAHFLDRNGDGTFTYEVKFTISSSDGQSWSKPTVLHDDGKQAEHGFVSLLAYGDNFFTTWLDGRNTVMEGMENMDHSNGHHGEMSLRAAVIDATGKKLNEWELDKRTCDCCQTGAAITANGPVVVYRDRSNEEIRDMSIVRFVDGQWTEPKSIHEDNWKIAGCPVNGPRLSAMGNTLAVAWFTVASDKPQVNVIFSSDNGATFSKPIRVDEGKAIGRVDIVLLNETTAMVSWMEGTEIRVAQISSDGAKAQSTLIAASSESRSSGFPQMTKLGSKLIFAWTDDKTKTIKMASATL